MRRVLLALATAVMMVAMVSCSNGDKGDPGDEGDASARDDDAAGDVTADAGELGRAVEATGAVERARVELQTAYTGLARLRDMPAGVDDVRMIQRAEFDRPAGRVRAESDMSELAAMLETADESVPGDYSLPTRFVIDGDTVYAQIGPMARSIGLEPTSWIKRDLVGFAEQSIDNETAALLLDPLGMLGLLARPVTAVRSVGYDHVRGVATTHLTVSVDLRPRPTPSSESDSDSGSAPSTNGSSPTAAGEAEAAAPEGDLEARFRAIGVDELAVDVYIDAEHIIRRLEFRLDAGSGTDSGSTGQGALTTTFDVYDVGDAIDIALPGSADVIDQADLQSRLDP
jgi:hypothetical protein